MSESNFRLAEHQVEMNIVEPIAEEDDAVYFMAEDGFAQYHMSREKWTVAHEPKVIYVTVTAVTPTSEPADDVEVFRSASTGEFVSEEFAERNPSTTMKHSVER